MAKTAELAAPQGGETCHEELGEICRQEPGETRQQKTNTNSERICVAGAPHTFDFDVFKNRFAEVYPRVGDREATDAALEGAIEAGADPAHILAGARAYAEEQKGNARQYIAFSENWLAKKRWEQFASPGAAAGRDTGLAAAVEDGYRQAIREGNEALAKYTPVPLALKFIAEGSPSREQCRAMGILV